MVDGLEDRLFALLRQHTERKSIATLLGSVTLHVLVPGMT